MRKVIAATALTVAGLGLTAGAASAAPTDVANGDNTHGNTAGDSLLNLNVSPDVLTNTNIDASELLSDGILTNGIASDNA